MHLPGRTAPQTLVRCRQSVRALESAELDEIARGRGVPLGGGQMVGHLGERRGTAERRALGTPLHSPLYEALRRGRGLRT